MLEKCVHKGLEILEHQAIGSTSILGSDEILHQNTDKLIARALVIMLVEHNTDGISNAAAVHSLVSIATQMSIEERIAVWEQHLLLLLKMALEVGKRSLEEWNELQKFGVSIAVHTRHSANVVQEPWAFGTNATMVNLQDIVDEQIGRPTVKGYHTAISDITSLECSDDFFDIGARSTAGILKSCATTTAEVDAKILKDARGSKIIVHERADCAAQQI